ncbi:hypothetical protein PR048_008769 [Dryococelus australis]|uniref:Lipase domain-containing protein n=1 Tax=Dryococelus australis TaxID=614101 RepID=A0ABQ9HY12_9NEOP|nr:hypothetical protein PR048_008769 [Dryococelus australis]
MKYTYSGQETNTGVSCADGLCCSRQDMRRELLKYADWNVVVVDWAGGSLPLYTQATANTRLVGLEIAYFVNYLQVTVGMPSATLTHVELPLNALDINVSTIRLVHFYCAFYSQISPHLRACHSYRGKSLLLNITTGHVPTGYVGAPKMIRNEQRKNFQPLRSEARNSPHPSESLQAWKISMKGRVSLTLGSRCAFQRAKNEEAVGVRCADHSATSCARLEVVASGSPFISNHQAPSATSQILPLLANTIIQRFLKMSPHFYHPPSGKPPATVLVTGHSRAWSCFLPLHTWQEGKQLPSNVSPPALPNSWLTEITLAGKLLTHANMLHSADAHFMGDFAPSTSDLSSGATRQPQEEVFLFIVASKREIRNEQRSSAMINQPLHWKASLPPAPNESLIQGFFNLQHGSNSCLLLVKAAPPSAHQLAKARPHQLTVKLQPSLHTITRPPVPTNLTLVNFPRLLRDWHLSLQGHAAASGFTVYPQLLLDARLITLTAHHTAGPWERVSNLTHPGLLCPQKERPAVDRHTATDISIVNSKPVELLPSEPANTPLCYKAIVPPTQESPLDRWLCWCTPDEDNHPEQSEAMLPTNNPDHQVPPVQEAPAHSSIIKLASGKLIQVRHPPTAEFLHNKVGICQLYSHTSTDEAAADSPHNISQIIHPHHHPRIITALPVIHLGLLASLVMRRVKLPGREFISLHLTLGFDSPLIHRNREGGQMNLTSVETHFSFLNIAEWDNKIFTPGITKEFFGRTSIAHMHCQECDNKKTLTFELSCRNKRVACVQSNMGLDPADVHMIGHSLGAHTAAYAGERIDGLGRITGLDPAEPYFQGMPNIVRLDSSDANLVDVIHTDGKSIFLLGYGMSQPCGHLDFYPNNGKEQPGCDLTETPLPLTLIKEGIEEASRVLVACNHIRAIKLFIDSINTKCPYVAHRCDSFQHFMQVCCLHCRLRRSTKQSAGDRVFTSHAGLTVEGCHLPVPAAAPYSYDYMSVCCWASESFVLLFSRVPPEHSPVLGPPVNHKSSAAPVAAPCDDYGLRQYMLRLQQQFNMNASCYYSKRTKLLFISSRHPVLSTLQLGTVRTVLYREPETFKSELELTDDPLLEPSSHLLVGKNRGATITRNTSIQGETANLGCIPYQSTQVLEGGICLGVAAWPWLDIVSSRSSDGLHGSTSLICPLSSDPHTMPYMIRNGRRLREQKIAHLAAKQQSTLTPPTKKSQNAPVVFCIPFPQHIHTSLDYRPVLRGVVYRIEARHGITNARFWSSVSVAWNQRYCVSQYSTTHQNPENCNTSSTPDFINQPKILNLSQVCDVPIKRGGAVVKLRALIKEDSAKISSPAMLISIFQELTESLHANAGMSLFKGTQNNTEKKKKVFSAEGGVSCCVQGRCFSCRENSTSCALMGLHADQAAAVTTQLPLGSKYYFSTGKGYPFCREYDSPTRILSYY